MLVYYFYRFYTTYNFLGVATANGGDAQDVDGAADDTIVEDDDFEGM